MSAAQKRTFTPKHAQRLVLDLDRTVVELHISPDQNVHMEILAGDIAARDSRRGLIVSDAAEVFAEVTRPRMRGMLKIDPQNPFAVFDTMNQMFLDMPGFSKKFGAFGKMPLPPSGPASREMSVSKSRQTITRKVIVNGKVVEDSSKTITREGEDVSIDGQKYDDAKQAEAAMQNFAEQPISPETKTSAEPAPKTDQEWRVVLHVPENMELDAVLKGSAHLITHAALGSTVVDMGGKARAQIMRVSNLKATLCEEGFLDIDDLNNGDCSVQAKDHARMQTRGTGRHYEATAAGMARIYHTGELTGKVRKKVADHADINLPEVPGFWARLMG